MSPCQCHIISLELNTLIKFFIQSEKEEKKAQIHKQLVISIGEYIRRLEEAGNPVYLMAVWGDLASTSY